MIHTVLGSTGFIGQHLKNYLISKKLSVLTPSVNEILNSDKNWGSIYYLIGLTSDFRTKTFETVDAHVTQLNRILHSAQFDSLIYASSTRLYKEFGSEGDHFSVSSFNSSDFYNITKIMGESLCFASGKENVRVVRLSNVIGRNLNRNSFLGEVIKEARTGRVEINSHSLTTRDFIDVASVVRILEKIALFGSERIYNVASGKPVSNLFLVDTLQEFMDFKVTFREDLPRISSHINVERLESFMGNIDLDMKDKIKAIIKGELDD